MGAVGKKGLGICRWVRLVCARARYGSHPQLCKRENGMAKKKAKKKSKKAPAPAPNLVVKSVCKEILKGHDCNVAGDALEGLNAVVAWYLDQAAARAAANGRKTVRAHDFITMG